MQRQQPPSVAEFFQAITNRNSNVFNAYLDAFKNNPHALNVRNQNGETPLIAAIRANNTDFAIKIAKLDHVNIQYELDSKNALVYSFENPQANKELIALLKAKHKLINKYLDELNIPAELFLFGIQNGKPNIIAEYFRVLHRKFGGIPPDNNLYATALFYALQERDHNTVKVLLENGAPILHALTLGHPAPDRPMNALDYARHFNDAESVDLIRAALFTRALKDLRQKRDVPINMTDIFFRYLGTNLNYTAEVEGQLITVKGLLFMAAKIGLNNKVASAYPSYLQFLVGFIQANPREVNFTDHEHNTLLHYAVRNHDRNLITNLLVADIDVSVRNNAGVSALEMPGGDLLRRASQSNAAPVVRSAARANRSDQSSDVPEPVESQNHFLRMVFNDDVEGVRNFLDQPGANNEINRLDTAGFSALHIAVWRGNSDMVNELMSAGIDTNIRSGQGLTAAQFAERIRQENLAMQITQLLSLRSTDENVPASAMVKPAAAEKQSAKQAVPAEESMQAKFDKLGIVPDPIFICPISQEAMNDPVAVNDGQTYDRSSLINLFRIAAKLKEDATIEQIIKKITDNNIRVLSPMNRQPLDVHILQSQSNATIKTLLHNELAKGKEMLSAGKVKDKQEKSQENDKDGDKKPTAEELREVRNKFFGNK